MKTTFSSRHRKQQATVVLLLIIVFVLFLAVIGGIFVIMWQAIHKIKTPPPDEPGGWSHPPPIGSKYQGGIVQAYVGSPSSSPNQMPPVPEGFVIDTVSIYSGPDILSMTNLLYEVPFADLDTVLGANGLPLEEFPADQQPSQRFYNFVVSGH